MDIDFDQRCVALVGGAGFIGHHLAVHLARSGAQVHVIDALANRKPDGEPVRGFYSALLQLRSDALLQAGVRLHVLDAREAQPLWELLEKIRPDAVIQLAAIAAADATRNDPRAAFSNGLETLVNSLEYARRGGTHVLYVSSSMVYGDFKGDSATEEDACEPIGLYGVMKRCGEQIVTAYGQTFGIPYTIVRPSAVYGEGCVARRVTQVYIENALLNKPLVVKGDGSDALDFTYIGDLVHGISLCLARPEARGQIFNLTFGDARTLNQAIAIVKENFPGVSVMYEPREQLMPKRGTLSVEKGRRMLGYMPRFPLEKGLVQYIESYKNGTLHEALKSAGRLTGCAMASSSQDCSMRTVHS